MTDTPEPSLSADPESEPAETKSVISLDDLPADAPIPVDPSFRIEVPGFEGPLDLLLYLIKKHQLDILDLPISFITERYLEYLSLMEELNLDVASEYLVMAATLAHIKSKGLLPRPPEDQDDVEEDEIDPRAELIRRLLEYQKYKRAGEGLGSRGVAGRDVFPRGAPGPKAAGPADLAEFSVFKLIDAFQSIVKRRKGEISLEVDAERITIQQRIAQIVESLRRSERTPFETLFGDAVNTYDLVVTFLALLEMAKMRLLRIYQTAPEEPIYLEARVLDADAVEETIARAGADFGEVGQEGAAVAVDPDEEPKTDPERDTDPGPATEPPPAGTPTIPAPAPEMQKSEEDGSENPNDSGPTTDPAPPMEEPTLENGGDSDQDRQP